MDKCTQCRRFGAKLFLKGERCVSTKCALTRRNYKPGIHGPKSRPGRKSEYGLQLLEKQKAKTVYGLREQSFIRIFKEAARAKENTSEELFRLLETRLDNCVYRLGWAASRSQARQLVLHRKIKVNDKILNIPSAQVKANDIVTPKDAKIISIAKVSVPAWLKLEEKNLKAKVARLPQKEDIETDLDGQLIIEFYSR